MRTFMVLFIVQRHRNLIRDEERDFSPYAGHNLIATIIDKEQIVDNMMIRYGISEELDTLKHAYLGLPDFLTTAS